jgi:hypothetical protein
MTMMVLHVPPPPQTLFLGAGVVQADGAHDLRREHPHRPHQRRGLLVGGHGRERGLGEDSL